MVKKYFKNSIQKGIDSFSSRDFIKAISMIIGMIIPIIIGVRYDALAVGTHITLGVLFTSFSDTTGYFRLNLKGMFMTILLTLSVTYIMHFLKFPIGLFLPLLGILIFGLSFLSVYGHRASLVSFAGLFSIVLSMSSLSDSDLPLYTRLFLIGTGGLWYLLLVVLRTVLFPKNSSEYYLAEALDLTADYMEIRARLIDRESDRKELIKDLLKKQNELTTNHETLRELLFMRRLRSGRSNYQARRAMILREVIDILELAMANPVNYFKTDSIFENNPGKEEDFRNLIQEMSDQLRHLGHHFTHPKRIQSNPRIDAGLEQIKKDIIGLIATQKEANYEDSITLKNHWKYLQNQYASIRKIEQLITNRYTFSNLEKTESHSGKVFVTQDDYSFRVLVENFSFDSSIFRHSLRIAVVGTLGYALGYFLNLVNAYWILMTIIIIMRPNFGLTKERFRNRSLGTVIGGAVAFVTIYFIHSPTLYGILAVLCYTIGLSMVQRNYKAAAAFITMYVLFVYSMLHPDVFKYIQYRVLDTLLGAGLAYFGSRILWPMWEIKSMDTTLKDAIRADREYLAEIAKHYNEKGPVTTAYKLKRKEAFLALSELSSAFQRMTQEPRSQHASLNEVFQLVMLMHSFLASLASLGTFIVNNKTSPASEGFNLSVNTIKQNLWIAEKTLKKSRNSEIPSVILVKELDSEYKNKLEKIAEEEAFEDDWETVNIKEEAHLLMEQFQWLVANSQRMTRIIHDIKFE